MKKIDFQKVVEWLSFVLKCPVCNYKYNLERTKIVDTKQDESQGTANLLVHSDCGQCKSSVVFGVSINGPEIFTVGIVTDLTSTDSQKFVSKDPLNIDDCLAVHNFLKNFDGNFSRVLSK